MGREAELAKAGVVDLFQEHGKRPLAEHLRAKNNSDDHVNLVISRACKMMAGSGFNFIADLSASRVESFLADLREEDYSIQTSNHYLRNIKQFAR